MSAGEIRARLFGVQVSGEYSTGRAWAERFNADGTSDYAEDGKITRGRMSLEGRILCFDYAPQEMNGGCFEIWQRGANCFDFYSVGPNITPATREQKRFGRSWDARAWIDGEQKTCETDAIS